MPNSSVRLFLSCVSGEFGAYRDVLRRALTRPNVEVKVQEDFKALGGDTLKMLTEYIEQCEAIVHFVGDMAGSTPAASSVDDLLKRWPQLERWLAEKGLGRDALRTLSYTQWEAWLAIGFDKDLLIVAPAPSVNRGPNFTATEDSRKSQADHLQRLKAIDRYPIKFTNVDNLVASILESEVIDALVKAQAATLKANRREPFGATIAAIVAGIFVLFVDKMLPLEWFGGFPIFIRVLAAVTAGLFAWLAWRYWDILGGADKPRGSCERGDYDGLLKELKSGGAPAKVYRNWLTKVLDRVDVFFGDPGRDDKSLFARTLGLGTPGARWTAPAFDRCLLLALAYPIVSIMAVWVWFGHVGVAERALGLWASPVGDALGSLRRAAFGISLAVVFFAFWGFAKSDTFRSGLLWVSAVAVASAVAFVSAAFALTGTIVVTVASVAIGAFAGAVCFAAIGVFSGAVALTGVFAFAFAFVSDSASADSIAGAFAFSGAIAATYGCLAAAAGAAIWSARKGRQGTFLSLLFAAATGAVFCGVLLRAPSALWPVGGPIFLVFGVLTLVNTPFDWFAVGLTRALLRRGLAPGGRGPFFYAALDAFVAPPVIALLAFVTIFAVQTFDDIAVLRAGAQARTLPLGPLFEGLETRPGDPEFWWVWLMLFSTLIPSALNLCIACASLIRGAPFLNTWIVKRMQPVDPARDSDRLLLASALAVQIAGGVLATGVALYLIGIWFLPIWLPILGGFVRDFSEALAAYNAPARVMMWFAGAR
jgi:hypothetical protein